MWTLCCALTFLIQSAVPVDDPEPNLVPYATPTIEKAQATRKGKKVNMTLRWTKVSGASNYQLQISKVLTFQRPIIDTKTSKTRHSATGLSPGVYFWRVRATGKAGDGEFTPTQVLDATKTQERVAKLTPKIPASEVEIEPDLLSSPPSAAPVLRLVWLRPEERATTTESEIKIEGVATKGAEVWVGESKPVLVTASFSIGHTLKPGRNDVTLEARLGDLKKSVTRVLYLVDQQKFAQIKEALEALRTQINDIEALRGELTETIQSFETRIKETKDLEAAVELQAELVGIQEARKELEKEVNQQIDALDKMLR